MKESTLNCYYISIYTKPAEIVITVKSCCPCNTSFWHILLEIQNINSVSIELQPKIKANFKVFNNIIFRSQFDQIEYFFIEGLWLIKT